jgi:hypothetical protein
VDLVEEVRDSHSREGDSHLGEGDSHSGGGDSHSEEADSHSGEGIHTRWILVRRSEILGVRSAVSS